LPTRAGFSRGDGPTRRDVLRLGAGGLAAAVLAPLTGCSSDSRGRQSAGTASSQRTVIVIGAGFAGLACADTLAHGGVNVILLEATGRPGGRVRTDRKFVAGDNVELGGEWIGANHPTWLAFAQEFGLRLEEPNAAPQPEGVAPPAAGEGTAPATNDGAAPAPATGQAPAGQGQAPTPPAGRAYSTPRPVPFETEMDPVPASANGTPGPQSAVPTRVIAAAMLQQPANGNDAATPQGGPGQTPPHKGKEGDEPLILNGKLIRGAEADKLYEEVDGVLAKIIDLARNVDPVRPWLSPNAAELDARSFAQFVGDQQGLSEPARTLLLTGAESDNGVPADRMSLLAYCAMVAGGGLQDYYELSETYRLAEGNDALATALSQKLGSRIVYSSYVDAIRRTPYGVIVRTRGGEYYRGDAVVIAVPPSVWGQFAVEPPLADSLRPQMGENVKLLLALREPVWEREGLTSEVTSDGLVGLTWAATDTRAGRGPVGLTLFSGAAQAETLRRLAPPERQAQAIASIAPAYPALADSVTKERFVDWPGMPLTRASYSFPAPGQVTAFGPVLVDGLYEEGLPPVLFAGEHTSYGFVGYMEGALSSGVRAARILLGTVQRVENAAPPVAQPAETQPAAPQTAPVTEPVKEGTPA
jgi:monoamine oxidase